MRYRASLPVGRLGVGAGAGAGAGAAQVSLYVDRVSHESELSEIKPGNLTVTVWFFIRHLLEDLP